MKPEGSMNYYRIELNTRKGFVPIALELNSLNIKLGNRIKEDSNSFIVCLPVVYNLKRTLMLIQLIEAYIKYGVKKIVINYYSASSDVLKVLKYYSKLGYIDVYQYNNMNDKHFIELENDNNTIYHLQMWKINHCFYEYKTPSNHFLFLDIDEILFTTNHISYFQLFDLLPKMDMYFLNQFFYKIESNIDEKDDRITTISDVDIYSIRNYCKPSNGFCHKYIIYNTNKFYKAQVHEALYENQISEQYISDSIAYIKHTRHYNKSIKDRCDESMLVDNGTSYYSNMHEESIKKYKHITGHDLLLDKQ